MLCSSFNGRNIFTSFKPFCTLLFSGSELVSDTLEYSEENQVKISCLPHEISNNYDSLCFTFLYILLKRKQPVMKSFQSGSWI